MDFYLTTSASTLPRFQITWIINIDINTSGLPARMILPESLRYQLKAPKADEY